MRLRALQRHWDSLGERDPFWAILTAPGTEGNKWDPAEFLETGRAEVAAALASLDALGVTVDRGTALDFGCGAGRCTQHLARHFATAVGVDIAPSMVALARDLAPDDVHVDYAVNDTGDLRAFADASFDLVYCNIVLQHMEPGIALGYVTEFFRVLRPGGAAMFQVATAYPRRSGLGAAKQAVRRALPPAGTRLWDAARHAVRRDGSRMEMYAIPEDTVTATIAGAGGEVRAVFDDTYLAPEWRSRRFVAVRA